LGLLPFLTNRQRYYPELVRVFYSNLQITEEGVILSEVKHAKIRMDIDMFYRITQLGTQGVCFEGNIVQEWRDDYSSHNAKMMICRDNVNIGGRILAGQMRVETRILHYILCRCLEPRSTNLAQATEEDIILMWAMLTGRQLNWGHLIRYRMKKALKDHAPLPYANHITDIFIKFNVPLDDEPFEEINWRTGPIGAEVIHSFGFVKNQNGEWIHKRDMQDAPIHDDRTPSPPPQPTQDASAAMLNDIIHEIRDLRAFVGSRFDSIDARVGQLEEDMAYVRRQFPPS